MKPTAKQIAYLGSLINTSRPSTIEDYVRWVCNLECNEGTTSLDYSRAITEAQLKRWEW